MATTAYRLFPRQGGGFHLGREGLDQEVSAESFPSDSMYAALIAAFARLHGSAETEAFLSEWPVAQGGPAPGAPPFRISSLFPFAGDLLLYPKPRMRVIYDESLPGRGKKLKKVLYVSRVILERILIGQPMDGWLPGEDSNGVFIQDGKVWLSAEEVDLLPGEWQRKPTAWLEAQANVWHAQPVPRVNVDRVTNQSTIFHVGRTVFAEGCGLWFRAEIERDAELLDDLLSYLADAGIGGERSAGYGAFTVDQRPAETLPDPAQANRVMTLSRYNPTVEEWEAGVMGPDASYELVDVGGWLASPQSPAQRRKRVRMIEAGSILEARTPITGRLVDVRPEYDQPGAPDHPVYRSGIALTIGVPGGD